MMTGKNNAQIVNHIRYEGMYYNNALISLAVTAKLICAFGFAYVACWFSHEVAHLIDEEKTSHTPEAAKNKHQMIIL